VLHAARPRRGQLEPRYLPTETLDGAYAAWQVARAKILEEWQPLTDAQTMRPRVPRVMVDAAAHVRAQQSVFAGGAHAAEQLVERLEGAYSYRIQRRFRQLEKEDLKPEERAERIATLADELDLRPYRKPDPLPSADEDDAQVVAWLALTPPAGS
jgi:hypothetical protein